MPWAIRMSNSLAVAVIARLTLSECGSSFNVGDLDEIPPADYDENGEPIVQTYDLISLFNVLDRCQRPRKLLADIQRRMAPGHGRFILAVVLPFDACVEVGASARVEAPHEALQLSGSTWEVREHQQQQQPPLEAMAHSLLLDGHCRRASAA